MASTSPTPDTSAAAPQDETQAMVVPPPAPSTPDASVEPLDGAALLSALSSLRMERVHKSVFGASHEPARVELALDHVAFSGDARSVKLQWADVLGAHVLTTGGERLAKPVDARTTANKQHYLLGVFACPTHTHKPGTVKKRHLMEFFFRFQGADMPLIVALQAYMNFLADPRSLSAVAKAASVADLSLDMCTALPSRKYLVLVNPVGGAGKGVQTFETKAAPIFRFANIETTVKLTERPNHALEMVQQLPLGEYDCVVAVGGDGSLYEIVQGLMKREDWNKAIRQPIGIIPSGSGNGLAHSIAHQSQEKGKPANAAFMLAKGVPHDLDITSMRNGKETTYSFLSLEWASIADVDINSEKMRALGGLRFTVAFIHQLFFLNKEYGGKLWYLEEDSFKGEAPPRYFDVVDPESSVRPEMDLFENPDELTAGGKWKEVGDRFRLVWAMNISHAAGDAILAPGAQFDDGYNYITLMHGDHSKKDMVAMLLAIENGEHVDKPGVQHIKTRAFKIQPSRPDDLICVDGELFDGPYLEAQVHRGMACVMAIPEFAAKK